MALVTSKEMFAKAYDGGYAIGAFNVNNMEIVQGITEACQEEHAPVILQVSKGARAYANHTYLVKLVEAAVETCPDIPIVLHLDHGPDFETCKSCIDGGFTSVMIDASSKPFAENIEITRKVVEYAHDHGVVVEAELGTLAGIEDEVKVAAHEASYTRPEEVEEFVSKTGCDSLAIAIGTSHGAYKFKPEQCTRNEQGILVPPPLRFDVLEEVSKGARAYANHTYLVKLVEAAVACCPDIPIVLHLDHGPDFETCKSCIDGGFTSVMIDASSKPFAENIEITRQVVEYAHDHGVVVEAELGTLAGIEDEVKVAAHEASYTRPEEVEEFVAKTGCDSLAIAIGTSHGAYKFKPEQCTRNEQGILVPPPLRFDVLEEVSKRLPGFPIVLHGSSSVPQNYVKMINEHGGKMPNAIGVPEEQLRQAARLSVCKINIDSDLRLAMTGTIRQFMDEHPDKFDPREYLKPARTNIKELVRHKLVDVLGCAGKA